MTPFAKKTQAIAAVKAQGYTHHEGTGESGDHGYGSREYFSKPGCARNTWGAALDTADVSKVGRVWYASINHRPI